MKFSIVLPTRGNVSGLKKMLRAIDETVSSPGNVEVLVAVDNDDPQYQEIRSLTTKFVYRVFQVERSENFSRDYYNFLASKSYGDAIQAFNDDAYYITKNWDEKIRTKVQDSRIWLADIYDTTRTYGTGNQPCFPMVSRKAYQALGFLLHPNIKTYPADRILYEVYKKAECVIDCTDVQIQHDRQHDKKERIMNIFRENNADGSIRVDTNKDADTLREALRRC